MNTMEVCSSCKEVLLSISIDLKPEKKQDIPREIDNNKDAEKNICKNCVFKEKWIHKEVKIKEGNAHEHLNQFRLFVVDIEKSGLNFPITVKVGDTNSYEWFNDSELEILDINQE